MYITFYSGDQEFTLGRAFSLGRLHVGLEMGYRRLHGFGAL